MSRERYPSDFKRIILDRLTYYPEGVNFNRLGEELKKDMSRGTLEKYLRELEGEGLIEIRRGRRGQRSVIRLKGDSWVSFRKRMEELGVWPERGWKGAVNRFGEALRRGDEKALREILIKACSTSALLAAVALYVSLTCPGAKALFLISSFKAAGDYLTDLFEEVRDEKDLELIKRVLDSVIKTISEHGHGNDNTK